MDPIAAAALLAAAACVGSFAALAADRLAAGEGWAAGRSRCDACRAPLAARDLAPVLSWAALRGRARCCGAAIPPRLPLAEASGVALTLWAIAAAPDAATLAASVALGWALLALALIDLRTLTLPDGLTLPLTLAGLGLAAAGFTGPPAAHAAAAALGWAAVWGTAVLWRRLRGCEGVGLGDAKLLAAAGAWTGFAGLSSTLLVACAVGLAQAGLRAALGRDWRAPLPFGPALAAGFWLAWIAGPLAWA